MFSTRVGFKTAPIESRVAPATAGLVKPKHMAAHAVIAAQRFMGLELVSQKGSCAQQSSAVPESAISKD